MSTSNSSFSRKPSAYYSGETNWDACTINGKHGIHTKFSELKVASIRILFLFDFLFRFRILSLTRSTSVFVFVSYHWNAAEPSILCIWNSYYESNNGNSSVISLAKQTIRIVTIIENLCIPNGTMLHLLQYSPDSIWMLLFSLLLCLHIEWVGIFLWQTSAFVVWKKIKALTVGVYSNELH